MSSPTLPRIQIPAPGRCRRACADGVAALALSIAAVAGAHAAEAGTPPPGVSFATMMQTFAALALILGLFVGAAWLMRRLNGGQGLMAGNGPMRIVGALQISPRERILLVEIEDTWLVIGIAPGQMRTLHTLAKGSLPPASTTTDNQFAHWLRQFRESSPDAKN